MVSVPDTCSRALIVAALALALAACQSMPKARPGAAAQAASKPLADSAARTIAAPLPPAPPPLAAAPAIAVATAAPEPEPDLWQAMRAGMTLPGCDYTPGIDHWARRYAASPRRFADVLDQLLPALDYVHREVEAKGLPSEFALLPIVESHFRPHAAPVSRPAGPWQMIGPTARSGGVVIDAWIDGRLNLAASTEAALVLLDRYGDYFDGDWRLVAFAYNAGEHRVRRALAHHEPGDDFESLRGLRLAPGTYDYLAKLLALSCLVREPERYDLDLPTLEHERRLHKVDLDGAVGTTLARALSGLDQDDFDRVNGGLKRGRTPPGTGHPLLVASTDADDTAQLLARIPPARRLNWQRRALAGADTVAGIASRHDLDADLLLAINALPADAQPAPGTRLWLPAEVGGADLDQEVASSVAGIHVVRSGDSLWAIARRYGLTVAQLLRYNRLDSSRLTPGQRLRLSAP
jgi:membrane-bound lytic murein transglycosylase D